jgi:hypothetical protein
MKRFSIILVTQYMLKKKVGTISFLFLSFLQY